MAVYINTLIGGDITIGSGGSSPAGHPETRFTLEGGTVETANITGTLDKQWLNDNGYLNVSNMVWLKTITQVDIGNTVTSIGQGAFHECDGLTSVTIPNSVTSMGSSTFADCTNLTSVTIGEGVTSIEDSAFINCSGLTNVTIGNGVTSIGDAAFQGCTNLTSVTIPDGVTSIGSSAFFNCSGLMSVTFNSFTRNQVKSMTTENYIFGYAFYDPDWNPIAKSFTAVCTDGSMTINFTSDEPAEITFTDL